jgi:hypothetical protein
MVPSESREVTGYHASEGLWGELNYGLIVQANAAGLPVASYPPMGADGVGDDGTRLRPLLNPTTGQLAFARQGSDVFTLPPRPSLPTGCGLLQTDAAGPGGTRLFPHLYRVSYGARLAPLALDLNVRDPRFKVVAESEVVRLVHKATGQVIQCRRVETEPVGPYQYRIDYFTGAIRFDKINYPDPTVFEVWADYQYRDNFTWADADPRGFVDDTVLATYVSRREMTVGLNVTGFDISSGKALPFSLARRIRLRNAIR